MRNRFGRTLRGLAAAAAVGTAIGPAGAVAASAATQYLKPGATQACGHNCHDLSSLLLGPGTIMNADVPGDTGTGGKAGQQVTLKFASNSRPNEDFTDYAFEAGRPEIVASFCAAWPAPQSFNPLSYVCQNYFESPVYEFNWSPFGNESGLCAGLARPGVGGQNVTLQDCGDSDATLWIPDLANCGGPGDNYCPPINGGDTNFSHPLVLTVNAGSSDPANQLVVQRENLLDDGTVADSQYFELVTGPA
jgi:hypothetical protein